MIINAKINGIQIGERTHHHDQVIVPMSFNTMNTIPSNPRNPIPDELLLEDFPVLISVVF
jgi:hypothetical protein